jgi:succinate dehydrogenase/fumarate reductase cytochrome b subunit
MRLGAQVATGALVYTIVMLSVFYHSVVGIYQTIRDARRG